MDRHRDRGRGQSPLSPVLTCRTRWCSHVRVYHRHMSETLSSARSPRFPGSGSRAGRLGTVCLPCTLARTSRGLGRAGRAPDMCFWDAVVEVRRARSWAGTRQAQWTLAPVLFTLVGTCSATGNRKRLSHKRQGFLFLPHYDDWRRAVAGRLEAPQFQGYCLHKPPNAALT